MIIYKLYRHCHLLFFNDVSDLYYIIKTLFLQCFITKNTKNT